MSLRKCHLILCIKSYEIFIKNSEFKRDSPQTKKNEDLKGKVLDNAGDLLNELRYIYKERQKKRRCFK